MDIEKRAQEIFDYINPHPDIVQAAITLAKEAHEAGAAVERAALTESVGKILVAMDAGNLSLAKHHLVKAIAGLQDTRPVVAPAAEEKCRDYTPEEEAFFEAAVKKHYVPAEEKKVFMPLKEALAARDEAIVKPWREAVGNLLDAMDANPAKYAWPRTAPLVNKLRALLNRKEAE